MGTNRALKTHGAKTPHRIFAILGLNRSQRDFAPCREPFPLKKARKYIFFGPPFARKRRDFLFLLVPFEPVKRF